MGLIGQVSCSSDARIAPAPSDAASAREASLDSGAVTTPSAADAARVSVPVPNPQPERETIQIILRSSPPGAQASVDGVIVGTTPAFWQGEKSSSPREFTFVRSGYGIARYRFVPIKDGVVHATLKPIIVRKDD